MRELLDRETEDVRASEAVALVCYQVKKWIGAFADASRAIAHVIHTDEEWMIAENDKGKERHRNSKCSWTREPIGTSFHDLSSYEFNLCVLTWRKVPGERSFSPSVYNARMYFVRPQLSFVCPVNNSLYVIILATRGASGTFLTLRVYSYFQHGHAN